MLLIDSDNVDDYPIVLMQIQLSLFLSYRKSINSKLVQRIEEGRIFESRLQTLLIEKVRMSTISVIISSDSINW